MCNLYTVRKSVAEIAAYFRAQIPLNFNIAEGDVYPGASAMVVREEGGARIVQAMSWGFPLAQKSKKTGLPIKPRPINNIADLDSYMWRFIAPDPGHRCLIPMTEFYEPHGEKGAKTRTRVSVSGQPIFAWAGMWKQSAQWGAVYAGLMTDCNEAIRPLHHRMPVLLLEQDHDRWLHGSLDDVAALRDRCFPDDLIVIEPTTETWAQR